MNASKHILITHEKGGAAVTTTAINLAAELAGSGWSTLVVDCDSRGDVSASLGIDPAPALAAYLTDRYIGREETAAELVRFGRAGLDVLPTTASGLRAALQVLDGAGDAAIEQWLAALGEGYDFVLYDAKAASGELRRVLMRLADVMVIPTRVEALGLPDIALLIEQYRQAVGEGEPRARRVIVLPSMVRRTAIHAYNLSVLIEKFGDLVPVGMDVAAAVTSASSATWLARDAVLAPDRVVVPEASSLSMTLREYAQDDPAALAYVKLAELVCELLGMATGAYQEAPRG